MDLKSLCKPSFIYVAIHMSLIFFVLIQNLIDPQSGHNLVCANIQIECNNYTKVLILLFNIIYVILFSWFLQNLCQRGYSEISWFFTFTNIAILFTSISVTLFAILNNKS